MFVFHEEVFSCVFPKKMSIILWQLSYDPLSFTINFFMSSSASFLVLAKYLAGPGLFLPQLLKLLSIFFEITNRAFLHRDRSTKLYPSLWTSYPISSLYFCFFPSVLA
jgi:hypothetical protein